MDGEDGRCREGETHLPRCSYPFYSASPSGPLVARVVFVQEKSALSAQLEEMMDQSLALFQKRDDLDELEGFQQQELAKVKHMVLPRFSRLHRKPGMMLTGLVCPLAAEEGGAAEPAGAPAPAEGGRPAFCKAKPV